jgi:hypothetical protein
LSLSWASKTCLVAAVCVLPQFALAEWVPSEGRFIFTRDVTKDECFGEAKLAAKRSAMSKFGLERLSSTTRDYCVDAGSQTNCELHQQTLNYFDGGYIAAVRNSSERRENVGSNEECVVSLEADVRKFIGSPDPNLIVRAEVTGSKRKLDGELFKVEGEATPGSFIYVDNEIKSNGTFQIPTKQNEKRYLLEAQFPGAIKKDEVTEYLIVLALKDKLQMFEEQTSEDFHRRLHDIGRQNWQKTEVGYSILKKE